MIRKTPPCEGSEMQRLNRNEWGKNIAQCFSINEWVIDEVSKHVVSIMLGMMVALLITLPILLHTMSANQLCIRSWAWNYCEWKLLLFDDWEKIIP